MKTNFLGKKGEGEKPRKSGSRSKQSNALISTSVSPRIPKQRDPYLESEEVTLLDLQGRLLISSRTPLPLPFCETPFVRLSSAFSTSRLRGAKKAIETVPTSAVSSGIHQPVTMTTPSWPAKSLALRTAASRPNRLASNK